MLPVSFRVSSNWSGSLRDESAWPSSQARGAKTSRPSWAPRALADAFDVIVGKDDVTAGKPAPDAYQLALKRLRLVARSTVALEDSPTGLASARAAGIRAIAVGHNRPFGEWVGDATYVSELPATGPWRLLQHLGLWRARRILGTRSDGRFSLICRSSRYRRRRWATETLLPGSSLALHLDPQRYSVNDWKLRSTSNSGHTARVETGNEEQVRYRGHAIRPGLRSAPQKGITTMTPRILAFAVRSRARKNARHVLDDAQKLADIDQPRDPVPPLIPISATTLSVKIKFLADVDSVALFDIHQILARRTCSTG